ncbi:MAG: elongation factor G, partial [Nitrospinota bacterium]
SVHKELIEDIVEADEKLMEKYLDGEELSDEALNDAFQQSMINGTIHPVLVVAAEKGIGTKEALDILMEISPPPGLIQRKAIKDGKEIVLDAEGGLVGFVYRTVSDEFVTRISYIRILSGKLSAQTGFGNRRTGKTEKISAIYKAFGKELKPIPEAGAGDIVAITKVEDITAGDTVTDDKTNVVVEEITYPVPMVSLAVKPKSRGDEQKIGSALKELEEDDKTFKMVHDEQTGELVISGMSDHHLSLMLKRLKRRRKVEVDTAVPKIPYKETISGKVEYVEYQHKKQTGGAGQYAKVFLNIEPKKRGEGYEFVDKIVGGVIDGPLKPSVDKGIQSKMKEGVIAGYPVEDVRVTLVDGKMHPVDSKDIAFQIAGREAFKKGFLQCNPVILEPIVKMEVVVHQEKMGDIIGDINSRRGKILSSNVQGDMEILEAQVPLAEVQHYQADLQSITGGEGSYTMQLSHYDPVSPQIQKSLIDEYEKANA